LIKKRRKTNLPDLEKSIPLKHYIYHQDDNPPHPAAVPQAEAGLAEVQAPHVSSGSDPGRQNDQVPDQTAYRRGACDFDLSRPQCQLRHVFFGSNLDRPNDQDPHPTIPVRLQAGDHGVHSWKACGPRCNSFRFHIQLLQFHLIHMFPSCSHWRKRKLAHDGQCWQGSTTSSLMPVEEQRLLHARSSRAQQLCRVLMGSRSTQLPRWHYGRILSLTGMVLCRMMPNTGWGTGWYNYLRMHFRLGRGHRCRLRHQGEGFL
jgi:hypothetical protein